MSDQRVETHVVVSDPDTGRQRAIHFQEWWVRHRAAPEPAAFVQVGWTTPSRPRRGRGVRLRDAVLLAPSNPVVSIGTSWACRVARRPARHPRADRRRLPDRRRRRRAGHGRPLPRPGYRGQRRGRGRHYGACPTAACSPGGWWPRTTRRTCRVSTSGGCRCSCRTPQRRRTWPAPRCRPQVSEPGGARPADRDLVLPVGGLPEFAPGDDPAELIAAAAPWLADGDVVVTCCSRRWRNASVRVAPGTDREARQRHRRRDRAGQHRRAR